MQIEVRLFATMVEYRPESKRESWFQLTVEPATTVEGVLKILKIPHSMPKIILVNGKSAESELTLEPNDVLGVFPPIGGG
jgi:molybdopterin synthase sulfur carrier subunit